MISSSHTQHIPAIERTLDLAAPPERLWRALTDPIELSRWFSDQAEVDLRPGGNGTWTWHTHGRHAVKFEIIKPQRRLAWRWSLEPGIPVDVGITTRVEWTLAPRHDGGTTLRLEETGFTTTKHYEANVAGWKRELRELVAYVSAGSRE